MLASAQLPEPAFAPTPTTRYELGVLSACAVAGMVLSAAVGYAVGGPDRALEAAAGMGSAIVGGFVGWGVVSLFQRDTAPVTAVPMVGMMVRFVVTGLGVGVAVLGFALPHRPVLLAAMFGYLVMMAAEVILLYRSSSRRRTTTVTGDAPR